MAASNETGWDGRGLPPAARNRLEAASQSRVRSSLLGAPDAAALASVGFTPVGEAMGCCVQHWGAWKAIYCGTASTTVFSGHPRERAGVTLRVQTTYRAWDAALQRMAAEATALGADGVVGVQLVERQIDSSNREYLVLGTAVRGRGPARAVKPFTTDLGGCDAAKLLQAGWVPASLVIGLSLAIRHDGWRVYSQSQRFAGNTEVDPYTDLVTVVRHDARAQFEARARAGGAAGAIMSRNQLRVWEQECHGNDKQHDHLAQCLIVGTAIADFRREPDQQPAIPLRIMPLTTTEKRSR